MNHLSKPVELHLAGIPLFHLLPLFGLLAKKASTNWQMLNF